MRILFATPLRGFWKHLLNCNAFHAEFEYSSRNFYELNGKKQKIIKGVARWRIFDWFGVIRSIKVRKTGVDAYGSYNRFLQADKPYFIYVENPTALYHYRLGRKNSFWGNKRIIKLMNDDHLKALVFMSMACEKTFERVCIKVPSGCMIKQIYPFVPENSNVTENIIRERCVQNIKLLFIAQGVRFLSKGALEVIEAFVRLRKKCNIDITLTMVTSLVDADKKTTELIKETDGVSLFDFVFDFNGMQKLYSTHTILLIPTSDDSFPLTILEAMKSGLPIIGTSLYAIPEMVKEGVNGFLTDPAWWFFNKDNIPNPSVWNNRKRTIYSGERNERIVDFIYEKVALLDSDRDLLFQMSNNSLKMSQSAPFGSAYIVSQWNKLFEELVSTTNNCQEMQ